MQRMRIPQRGLLLAVGLVLAACSTQGTFRVPVSGVYPPPEFTHRVASPQLEVYWSCIHTAPDTLQVDGVVHNFGGREVRFVSVQVVGVNARGGTVSQASASLPEAVLQMNESAPFHLTLRTAGTEVRFDLYYQYRTSGHSLGFFGASSHESRWYARDICSPAQHLAQ